VLRACLDLLAVKHIWRMRVNTGAVAMSGPQQKPRFVRFGRKGCADILADIPGRSPSSFVWVECKSPGKKQSVDQVAFQVAVEQAKQRYLLVSDVDTLAEWLKSRGL
jgi:hypothetical protein